MWWEVEEKIKNFQRNFIGSKIKWNIYEHNIIQLYRVHGREREQNQLLDLSAWLVMWAPYMEIRWLRSWTLARGKDSIVVVYQNTTIKLRSPQHNAASLRHVYAGEHEISFLFRAE